MNQYELFLLPEPKGDLRETPQCLFDKLDAIFHFEIDAAANNHNAKLSKFWTRQEDGLAQDWNGLRIWCNPPYSRGQLIKWVDKALSSKPAVLVMLIPADTSTRYLQTALKAALEDRCGLLFLKTRLKFSNEESPAKFASCLLLYGCWGYWNWLTDLGILV